MHAQTTLDVPISSGPWSMFSPRGVSCSTATLLCGPEVPSDDKLRADTAKARRQKHEALLAARNVLHSRLPAHEAHAALELFKAPAPIQLRLQPSSSTSMIAAPPSLEDLMAVHQLCGGKRQAVIDFLARLWHTTSDAIAPTVDSWLVHLPPLKPPSRMRSAPAALAPAVEERLKSAAPQSSGAGSLNRDQQHRQHSRYSLAATAPAKDSKIAAALAGMHSSSAALHASMNRSLDRSAASRGTGSSSSLRSQVYTVPRDEPEFIPVVLTPAELAALPEVSPEEGNDEPDLRETLGLDRQARNFIARSAALDKKLTSMPRGMFRSTSGAGSMRF